MGLQTFLDLLEFVISLITSEGEGVHTDLDSFGLELMNVALNVGGSVFGRHEPLLQLLRQDVWAAIALAASRPNLATLSQACQVCSQYCSMPDARWEQLCLGKCLYALYAAVSKFPYAATKFCLGFLQSAVLLMVMDSSTSDARKHVSRVPGCRIQRPWPSECMARCPMVYMQVALSLYVHLGRRVLLQVEAFLGRLLLPLAEGKNATLGIARQEAALEVDATTLTP